MSKEEYMHETLKADAVCYDLPNEEIIQQLANENEELQSENKALREAVQRRAMEPHELLDIIAQAAGIQTGRQRWWDTTKENRLKLLLSKIKTLRLSKS